MVYPRGKGKQIRQKNGKVRVKRIYSYRFRFGGRIIHESAKTTSKTLAQEAERERRRELEKSWNHVGGRRELPPTFEQASKEYQESRLGRVSPHTADIDKYSLKHLIPVFGSTLLCDITADDLTRYQKRRQQDGAEGRTVNMEVGVLRGVLTAHRMWERIAPDVHMLPERKDIGQALTADEERRLLEATRRRDSACHTATVLALNTSMGRKEIRTLTWGQIDFEARTVKVGKSKNEFRTGRVIPLNPAAFEALLKWAGRYPDAQPTHCVFPYQDNRQIDPTRPTNGWRTAWEKARKQAGVNVRFHDLRVTCITKLAEGQASDQTIKAIAGHVSQRMLEHYSRIRMDAKRRALDAISQPLEPGVFGAGVHQNGNQLEVAEAASAAKLLN
jgi:integrase